MDQRLFIECTEYLKKPVKLDLPGWYCIEIKFIGPSLYICGIVSTSPKLMYTVKYQKRNKTRLHKFIPLYISENRFTNYENEVIERKPGYIRTATKDLNKNKIISYQVIHCDEAVEDFVLRRLMYETRTNIS